MGVNDLVNVSTKIRISGLILVDCFVKTDKSVVRLSPYFIYSQTCPWIIPNGVKCKCI